MIESGIGEREAIRRAGVAIEQALVERAKTLAGKNFMDSLTDEESRHVARLEAVRDRRMKGFRLLPNGQAALAAVHNAQALAGHHGEATRNAILQADARRQRRAQKQGKADVS